MMQLPLKVAQLESGSAFIEDSKEKTVCLFFSSNKEKTEANAAHIVKCVNLHDDLVKEIERLRSTLLNAADSLEHVGCKGESVEYYLNEALKTNDLLKRAKGE